MSPVDLMYWLQGYLEVDNDRDVLKLKVNEVVIEYEDKERTRTNSITTLKPFTHPLYIVPERDPCLL